MSQSYEAIDKANMRYEIESQATVRATTNPVRCSLRFPFARDRPRVDLSRTAHQSLVNRRAEMGSGSSSLAPSCPSPALIAFTAPAVVVQVEKTTQGTSKRKRKRSAVSRKSEQRRIQNMSSQKKYRDKRLHAGELVSLYCLFSTTFTVY
jgi:hypothetical protein